MYNFYGWYYTYQSIRVVYDCFPNNSCFFPYKQRNSMTCDVMLWYSVIWCYMMVYTIHDVMFHLIEQIFAGSIFPFGLREAALSRASKQWSQMEEHSWRTRVGAGRFELPRLHRSEPSRKRHGTSGKNPSCFFFLLDELTCGNEEQWRTWNRGVESACLWALTWSWGVVPREKFLVASWLWVKTLCPSCA